MPPKGPVPAPVSNDGDASASALPSISELQRTIADQASTIAELQSALATCREALVAMKDELRAKVQAANDLVEEVREAAIAGAGAVMALLPTVEKFYTRPKHACSKCGTTDAQALTKKGGSTKPTCYRGCNIERKRPRDQPEPTPILLNQQAKDAKKATFVFIYSRSSPLFVPPQNLDQRRVVLSNFVDRFFHHIYVLDDSPVFPGAGDIFVIQNFYVKLGPV